MQGLINSLLSRIDRPLIAEDGLLGPETLGALNLVVDTYARGETIPGVVLSREKVIVGITDSSALVGWLIPLWVRESA
jgi:hypothetical protein